jgi:hypothetical protein
MRKDKKSENKNSADILRYFDVTAYLSNQKENVKLLKNSRHK